MKIKQERRLIEGVTHDIHFDWIAPDGKPMENCGYSFGCDENGQLLPEYQEPHKALALQNYLACMDGTMRSHDGLKVGPPRIVSTPYRHWEPRIVECDQCGGDAFMQRGCGAYVCQACDNHIGLCRCYCGWSKSGGNGAEELLDMGENIEADY